MLQQTQKRVKRAIKKYTNELLSIAEEFVQEEQYTHAVT